MTHQILFTYDDGPSPWTEKILDLHAEYQAPAMFFMLGQAILTRTSLVERAHREGHQVGVHGFSHQRLPSLDDEEVHDELSSTQQLIELATGEKPSLFRAPYFDVDERILKIGASLGLSHVPANLIPDDWLADDPEALAAVVLDLVRPGSVVSLHDGVPPNASERCTRSREVTVEAVRLILEGLRA